MTQGGVYPTGGGGHGTRGSPRARSEAADGHQVSILPFELLFPLLQDSRQVSANLSEPEVGLHFQDVSPGAACRLPEEQVIPAESGSARLHSQKTALTCRRVRPALTQRVPEPVVSMATPHVYQQEPSCQFLPHESHSKGFCLFPLDKTDSDF